MSAVRKGFYSVVCFVTLGLSAWGAYTMLSVGMRSFLFKEADMYYPTKMGAQLYAEDEATMRKNAVARRQSDFSWALPVLIINLPMFLFFYPEVRKRD